MSDESYSWGQFLNSKNPIYVKNPVGAYIDCNQAFAELVGLSIESICGKTDLDLPGKPSILLGRHQKDVSFFKSQLTEEKSNFLISNKSSSDWRVKRRIIFSEHNEPFLIAELSNQTKDEAVIPLWVEPLRSIYDSHPEAILMIERGRVRYANKSFISLFGFSGLDDFLNKPFLDLLDFSKTKNKDKYNELKRIYRTIRKNGSIRLENYVLCPDGSRRAVEIVLYSMQGLGRRAYSVEFKDNQKLEDKTNQFERIVKNMPAVIFRFWRNDQGEFGIEFISDRCFEIYGKTPKEIKSNSQERFSPLVDKYKPDFFEGIEKSFKDLTPFNWEGEILNHKSELRWIQLSAEPMRVGDRTIWDGIIVDRSDIKRMQEKLDDSESISRQVFDNIPIGLFARSLTDNFKVVLWNTKMEEIFGLSADETIGKQALRTMPMGMDTEVIFDRYNDVIRQKKPLIIEREEFEKGNGQTIICRKILFPIFRDDKPIMVAGVVEDITESLEVLNELERQKAQLERQSRLSSLGEVSASLAHEINNPLAIIIGYATQIQKLLERSKLDKDKLKSGAEKIELTGKRITKIVRGLKRLSRDGIVDSYEAVNLAELFDESISLISEKMKMNQINFQICEFNEDDIVYGRSVEISQILVNLISNANDALSECPEKWIRVSYCQSEDSDYIFIEDSGPGIPADIQDEIVKPFFTTKEVGKGTGLGLSISKKIMETHGGELIYDKSSMNTCFVLRFPKTKTDSQASNDQRAS